MQFPEKYIKRGDFTLHSGDKTNIFYDVNDILTNNEYFLEIIKRVPMSEHYIGIATGGAIIAKAISLQRGNKAFSMIKDHELKGPLPNKGYILIDDVTTTESSLNEAIKIIGSNPIKIFVVVDRRKTENLNLEAMFKV